MYEFRRSKKFYRIRARFFDMLNDNDFVILRIIRVGYFFREVFTA